MSRRRVIGIVGVGAIALVVFILLLAHTAPVKNLALQQVRKLLASRGIFLTADSLDYNLLALRVRLRKVVVRGSKRADLPPLLAADAIDVVVSALDLIRGDYRVQSAELRDPRIHLILAPPADSNLPSLPQSGSPSGPAPQIRIDHLVASNGSLIVEDRAAKAALSLPRWELEIQGRGLPVRHNLRFDLQEEGSAEFQQRSIPVGNLHLDVVATQDSAELRSLHLSLSGSQLRASGSLRYFSQPLLDLTADSNLDIAPLADFAGVEQQLAGKLSLAIHANGPLNTLSVDLSGSGNNLQALDFGQIALGLQARYEAGDRSVSLKRLGIKSPAGEVVAQGRLSMVPAHTSSVTARLTNIDLMRLSRALDLQLNIASRASGSVEATWPGMLVKQMDGKAVLRLTSLRSTAGEKTLPISGELVALVRKGRITISFGDRNSTDTIVAPDPVSALQRLQAMLSVAQRSPRPAAHSHFPSRETYPPFRLTPVSLIAEPQERSLASTATAARLNFSGRLLRALFPQVEADPTPASRALEFMSTLFRGQISISPSGELSGNLRARVTDLQALLNEIARFQGKPVPLIGLPVRGNATLTAELGGTLKNPAARLQLVAPSFQVGDLSGIALEAAADYGPQRLTVRKAEVRWNDQAVVLNGTVGLAGKSPSLNLQTTVRGVALDTVLLALRRSTLPAAGIFSLDATVGGTLDKPRASARLRATGLQAYGEDWGSIQADLLASGDLVEAEHIELDKSPATPGTDLTAAIHYNRATRAYSLTADAQNLAIEHLTLPGGRTVQGSLSLNARGSGSVDDPRLAAGLEVAGLTVNQRSLGDIGANIQVADRRATIILRAPQWNLSVNANASINAPYPGEFRINARSFDLSSLPFQIPGAAESGGLSGIVSATIEGKGPLQEPRRLDVNGRVEQLSLGFRGRNIRTDGPLVFRFAEEIFQVEPSTIISGQSQLHLAGRIPLEPQTTPSDLRINGTLDLAEIMQLAGLNARAARARRAARLAVPTSGEHPNITETPASPEAPLSAPEAPLTPPDEEQDAAEQPQPQQPMQEDGPSPAQPAAAAEAPAPFRVRGQLNLDLTIRGTLRSLAPEGSILLKDGFLAGPRLQTPLRALNMTAQLQNGSLQLQSLTAQWSGANLSASGSLPLALLSASFPITASVPQEPASLTLNVEGFNPGRIQGAPDNVSGVISLNLNARAPALKPEALTADLRFSQLRVEAGGIPIEQQGESLITVRDGLVRVDRFQITGPETQLALTGTAQLTGERVLDLQMRGRTNAGLATVFARDLQIRGATEIGISAAGTLQKPQLQGFVALSDGQVGLANPAVLASGLDFRLNLSGNRIEIANFTGTLNGGSLRVSGGTGIGTTGLQDPDLRIHAENVYLDFPAGLRSMSSFDLEFTRQEDFYLLGGQVHLQEAFFRQYVNLEQGFLAYLRAEPEVTITEERSPFLDQLRFDIAVDTHTPILVDNNLAKVAIQADVRIVNTYYQPSVVGRVTLEEAGEIYFQGKTFYVDRGVVSLLNERRIEPQLDILTHTQTGGYDINMLLQGRSGNIQTTLTSDPPLPEPDIVSVLVFGRPLSEVRGAQANIVRQQAFSLVTGSLGGALSNQVQQATGLSEVRIEPSLIAQETTPTARLTVGQQLARGLSLIYSMDLANAGDQIWIGEYDITRRFSTRVTKQSDNSYRFDLRHDYQFGGSSSSRPAAGPRNGRRKVGSIRFEGETVLPERELARKLGVKPGDSYNFFDVRKGLDRIEETYRDGGRLEATVRFRSSEENGTVNLTIAVEAGPIIQFGYEGWDAPGGLKKRVEQIWRNGIFDAQRANDAITAIRSDLIDRGYLEARVEHSANQDAGQKLVIFDIQPGFLYSGVEVNFPGAMGISPEKLREVLRNGQVSEELLTSPDRVRRLLEDYYREQGHLTARVREPRPEVDPETRTGRILISVREGPQFRVAGISFQGNRAFSSQELSALILVKAGAVYHPSNRDPAIISLQTWYANHGYLDANVQYFLKPNPRRGTVEVAFGINENRQSVVRDIAISGNNYTTRGLISSQITVKPGQVLDASKLADSRANLYDTGAFQLVEVERRPLDSNGGLQPEQQAVEIRVNVQEVQPFRWNYGGYFDTDGGPGVISDFSSHNPTGNAQVIGLRTRYDRNRQEARLYFSQPLLQRFPVRTTGSTFFTRNSHYTLDDQVSFIDDHLGLSLEQESRFRKDYLVTWSYRLERVRIFGRSEGPLQDGDTDVSPIDNVPFPPPPGTVTSARVAPITGTLTRETRDDVLNATKGLFLSQSLGGGFSWLGSQQRYLKYFGQYYQYLPIGKPQRLPFGKGEKPRLLYAGGIRLGFAGGFGGQSLIQSERFFAGGGTTVRGFQQDEVGPKSADGVPLGGNALFILNNELRFPLFWIFDGVGFVDIGNVYSSIAEFNPIDVRKAAGVGIRIRTPYVLLRGDFGMKLDRRTGEKVGQFFFSIGQAY